ncbi:MAG: DUF2157 domain-containing protein [Patescibacteria group bacterium]|jgi:hypothetical protein
MATKEEILDYIKLLAEQKVVSKEELNLAFDSGNGGQIDGTTPKKLNISEVLYFLGGGIVFLGIAIMIAQNWVGLSSFTKILATLGSGIAAYAVGYVFSRDHRTEAVSSAFYLLSALVLPIGLWVVFGGSPTFDPKHGIQAIIAAILLALFLGSYLAFRKNLFALFSVMYGTWLFFSLTSMMASGNAYLYGVNFYQYRALALGVSYMLLGNAFSKNSLISIHGYLYSFGILGFLGSALSLCNWWSSENLFWVFAFPLLVLGAISISVRIKSKAFLVFGTIYLMIYILLVTARYFSTGLGWPLSLVMAGLALIGIVFAAVSVKKKYLTK